MNLTQGLKRAVQMNSQTIATIDGERHHTWQTVGERVAKFAGALQKLGLQTGDRVAILAANSDRYFESYFAILWAGGVIVPLNSRWAGPEIAYSLNDSGARWLIIDDLFYGTVTNIRSELLTIKQLIFAGDGDTPDDILSYEEMISQAKAIPDALRGGDDLAGIFYTGGTTGLSKGVMLSHTNLMSNAFSTIGQLGLGIDDRYLHAAPMFHLADGLATWAVTMVAGTHIFPRRFVPADILDHIQHHRVTFTVVVPTMLQMLMNEVEAHAYDLSSMRTLYYGASAMPEPVLRRAMMALPNCQFFGSFGMTELAPIATVLYPAYHNIEQDASKLHSVGQATLGVEVRIMDEMGQEVPRGTVGEITVRGPNVMQGYWDKPKQTAMALRDGWMHSGDAAYMDEDGFVFIVDRLKDMIITGGENVYSTEVERILYEYPGVAQAAVIGIPNEQWGEQVHAVIIPKPDADLDAETIIAHCQARIARYKCPRSIEFRDEPLPLSGAGKVLKIALREPYWQGRDKQVN